jgi:hypothetical protein
MCLVEVEHLLHNLQNDGMARCVPMETLRATVSFSAEEVTLPRLLPDEQKNSVDGIKFGRIHAFRAMQAVYENLVFMHEGTPI